MNRDQRLQNLALNLQRLCRSVGSVAEACRLLGVNRQQFNKYLAGKHFPSPKVLSAVADHFGLSEQELTASESQFETLLEGPQPELSRELRTSKEFQRFAPLITASRDLLRPYCGVYDRYHNSSIYKGRILRSALWLYERQSTIQYVCIERFPSLDGSGRVAYVFRYHGFALMVGDRLMLMDFEGIQRNELTFSILLPVHRNVLRFLYGIVTGVAATALREPFSTRIVLDFQGRGALRKKHLERATALLPSDKTIPIEVRSHLAGKNSTILRGGGP